MPEAPAAAETQNASRGDAALFEARGPYAPLLSFRTTPPGVLAVPLVLATGMLFATIVSVAAGVWTKAPLIPWFVALAIVGVFVLGVQYGRIVVQIGVDGIRLSGNEDAFIGRNEIASVEVEADGLQSGALRIKTKSGAIFLVRPPVDLAGIAERIRQIAALPPSSPHLREVQGLLGRGDQSIREWLASLRALGAGRADYRTTPFEADDLAALTTDGAVPPEVRVAAAVALRGSSPEAVDRVRVAASACASPRVRVCLESIAEAANEEELIDRVRALAN